MSERERLTELLEYCPIPFRRTLGDMFYKSVIKKIADYLLENGVIVLPLCDKVYFIIDKGSKFECVDSRRIETLALYEIRNLSKYCYYTTKEEAEKALKGGV